MTAKQTKESAAKGLAWKIHSSTRDRTWHTVVLHPDGALECSCEWGRNRRAGEHECKHADAVRAGDAGLPRPMAVWTDDEAAGMPARDWAALLDAVRMEARRAERGAA